MAGQVKHKQIFSSIKPDWRLAKVLLSLATRNTDSLIGAVTKVLADEGITLMNSTELLEPMLATEGVLTHRAPSDAEQTNITYGRAVAHHLSRFDIGQTVVIAEAACVAVEAMEGTDAAILRAGEIMRSPSLGKEPSTLSRALTVIKVAKPNQDMRFDVPVVGVHTIETMKQAGATCLALDAGAASCSTKKQCWPLRTRPASASSPRRRSATSLIIRFRSSDEHFHAARSSLPCRSKRRVRGRVHRSSSPKREAASSLGLPATHSRAVPYLPGAHQERAHNS